MVHAFAIAHLSGCRAPTASSTMGWRSCGSGCETVSNGGYFWGVDDEKPTNPTKQAYGHAFVLLAASSAMCVGHPDAPRLLADVTQVIEERFWDKTAGASTRRIQSRLVADGDLPWPELQHASHRSVNGGLRGDRRPLLSRQSGEHRLIDHRPPRPQRGLAGGRAFYRDTGRSTGRIGAIRCSGRAARRPAMRSNGAACSSSSGSLEAAAKVG